MGAKKELPKYSGDSNGWPRPRRAGPQTTTAGVGDGSNDDGDNDASDDVGHQHSDGQNGDENRMVTDAVWPDGQKIYISDDLTKMRANLAYQARQAKRAGKIADTWVIESKIMIKDRYMRITQVTSVAELNEKTQ